MKIHNTEIDLTGMETSINTDFVAPTRNYEKANDQHVRNIIYYANASKALFVDADKTKAADKTEALRLFGLGSLIIADGATNYVPTAGKLDGNVAKFTVGDATYTA